MFVRRIGRNVPTRRGIRPSRVMDESISVSPALDLGSALRAARPRWHMAASDLFRTRSSATHTVVRRDVVGQHRSNGAAPQSAAPGTSSRAGLISAVAMSDTGNECCRGRRRAGSACAQRRAACGFRRGAADWIASALHGQVVMVPEAGHYPQSQQPGITTGAIQRFLESVPSRAKSRSQQNPGRRGEPPGGRNRRAARCSAAVPVRRRDDGQRRRRCRGPPGRHRDRRAAPLASPGRRGTAGRLAHRLLGHRPALVARPACPARPRRAHGWLPSRQPSS